MPHLSDSISRLFGRKAATSPKELPTSELPITKNEEQALLNSFALYSGKSSLPDGKGVSLGLAAAIASEVARLTVTELSLTFDGTRAGRLLERALSGFTAHLRTYVEYACAVGGVMFKPFFDGRTLGVECLLPFDFEPLETDTDGRIVSCAFHSRLYRSGRYYTRIEEHRRTDKGYRITNRAYISQTKNGERTPCPLSTVGTWKGLSPIVEIEGLHDPLFVYFSMPQGNPDAPYSPLGVPIFRRAEELIRQADLQFHRLLWEFEGGELAVEASEDAFRLGKNGRPLLPYGKERLYRTNVLDACSSTSELLKTFSPSLRDSSLINGLNRILMFIEDACGIARGTFSDPTATARTATEIRAMRQRTHATVYSVRRSLGVAIEALVEGMNQLMRLYRLNDGNAKVVLSFGDGILTDSEHQRKEDREDVVCGILSKDDYQQKWHARKEMQA